MLSRISAHNFLGYQGLDLNGLDAFRMVLLEGDVGSGKSSIGEMIYYALYGEGRAALSELFKEDENGDMSVAVEFSSKRPKHLIRVERKYNGKTTSVQMIIDKKVVASGAGPVAEAVEVRLGRSASLLLLTDFYGLDANDALLKGSAAGRLEVLQEVVNIAVYQEFQKEAQRRRKVCLDDLNAKKSAAAATREMLTTMFERRPDPLSIERKISEIEREIELANKELITVRGKVERQEALLTQRRTVELNLEKICGSIEELEENVAGAEEAASDITKTFLSVGRLLAASGKAPAPLAKLQRQVADEDKAISRAEVYLRLHSEGAKALHDGDGLCPLCQTRLDSDTETTWKNKITDYTAEIAERRKRLKDLRAAVGLEEKRQAWAAELKVARNDQLAIEAELQAYHARLLKMRQSQSTEEARLSAIGRKLEGDPAERLAEIQRLISEKKSDLAALRVSLRNEEQALSKYTKAERAFEKSERDLKPLQKEVEAYDVVTNMFSRYGVPLTLLLGARRRIEEEASSVLSRFLPGSVTIADVADRGKPGLNFFYELEGHKRAYNLLSEGQRSLFYFSVRTAITRLLTDAYGTGPGFMFLDELATHLDAPLRAELSQAIRETCLKDHDQVLLTSHAPIPAVFDAKIKVWSENGSSHAELVAL